MDNGKMKMSKEWSNVWFCRWLRHTKCRLNGIATYLFIGYMGYVFIVGCIIGNKYEMFGLLPLN